MATFSGSSLERRSWSTSPNSTSKPSAPTITGRSTTTSPLRDSCRHSQALTLSGSTHDQDTTRYQSRAKRRRKLRTWRKRCSARTEPTFRSRALLCRSTRITDGARQVRSRQPRRSRRDGKRTTAQQKRPNATSRHGLLFRYRRWPSRHSVSRSKSLISFGRQVRGIGTCRGACGADLTCQRASQLAP